MYAAKKPSRATAMKAARSMSAERLEGPEIHCMKAERPPRITSRANHNQEEALGKMDESY